MIKTTAIAVAFIAMTLISFTAQAGPLDSAQVPQDSKWVVHIDAKSFFASEYGKLAVEDWKQFGLDKKVASIRESIGIDPLLGWESMTLYGSSYDHGDAIALVEVGDRQRNNDQLLIRKKNYKQLRHGKFVIHSWDEVERRSKKVTRLYLGVFRDSPQDVVIGVFGRNLDKVHTGLDTLAGSQVSLADLDADDPMAITPAPGSFFFVNAVDFAGKLQKHPRSFMFRNAEQFTYDTGEEQDKVYALATMRMKTANDAEALFNMASGMLAIGKARLNRLDDETAKSVHALADEIKLSHDETTVTGSFIHESAPLFETLRDCRDKAKARHAQRRAERQAAE